MADEIRKTLITELAEDSSAVDSDLFVVGDEGGSTLRKMTFANLAAAIKNKIASWTFSALNTTSKTLPGAVNELHSENVGARSNIYTGSSYNALKLTVADASTENRFFFFGLGSAYGTIIFSLYFRPSANTIKLENLGEIAINARWDGSSSSNTVVVEVGNYCNGVLISQTKPSVINLTYANISGVSLTVNSISGIGDGTVLGAIKGLNTNVLAYRGTSLTDANNTSLTPGVYRIGAIGSVANVPSDFAYGVLVVYPGGYNTQLLVNFNKAYIRDYTGNPAHWSEWSDIHPTKTIVTANISKSNVRKNTAETVGTLTLPAGHTYLVISYVALNKSGSGAFNHAVTGSVSGARTIRSTEQNGGGSCNIGLFNGGQTITTQVYLTTVDDATVSGALQAVKMY